MALHLVFLALEVSSWHLADLVGPGGFQQADDQIGLSIGAQADGFYYDLENPNAEWEDLGVVIGSGHTFTQNLLEVLLSQRTYLLSGSGNTVSAWSTSWQVYGCWTLFTDRVRITFDPINPVPLPAALPLFAGGLGLMGWMARRKRKQFV